MGDIHAGSVVVGSIESRAIALCDEEIMAATFDREREGSRCFGINANTITAAQAAVAVSQRQERGDDCAVDCGDVVVQQVSFSVRVAIFAAEPSATSRFKYSR